MRGKLLMKIIKKDDPLLKKLKKYKKVPIVIEAVELHEDFKINTLAGMMIGKAGDYLVKGIAGQLYPVNKTIFFMTYEEVIK